MFELGVARGFQPLVARVLQRGVRNLHVHLGGGTNTAGANLRSNPVSRKLVHGARNIINHTTRLLTHTGTLAAESTSTSVPFSGGLARSYHPSIQQRLSLSSRHALSRPLRATGLPRAPTVPRPMHEVGLGTVRKFSSGRTVFHHFVENTSITTRAFWEADWDIRAHEELCQKLAQRAQRKAQSPRKSEDKLKQTERRQKKKIQKPVAVVAIPEDDEMSIYFPRESTPKITTFLQIALAPTPASRYPLTEISFEAHSLLPLRSLVDTHEAFHAHRHDIAEIFHALDSAEVWQKGVSVESWGDPTGLCTELRVKFTGWTKSEVQDVLGDAANRTGIALQEVKAHKSPDVSIPSSLATSLLSSPVLDATVPVSPLVSELAIPMEFVMPTLDFSSAFTSLASSVSSPTSTVIIEQDAMSDFDLADQRSDSGDSDWSDSSSVPSVISIASSPSMARTGWISFSSDFQNRMHEAHDFFN